jgi:glutamine synthetase
MGIPIEYVHHEVGPSQHEIDMRFARRSRWPTTRHVPADRQGDREEGRLPRDLHAEADLRRERLGHAHAPVALQRRAQRLLRRRRQWHLSDAGKAFIAGQLRHAREIAAIFAQWVNSYKRLVPGYEAPVYVAWSQRNRSALIRIPLYKPGSSRRRARRSAARPGLQPVPDVRALLHAGLEGIEQGYELPEPMETNLYHLTPEQRRERGIVSLPRRSARRSTPWPNPSLPAKRLALISSTAISS